GVYGADGDRLPYSSRISGNLSLQQDFPISGNVTGFVGGMLSYVGNRKGAFTGSADRQDLAGYAKIDLRTGIRYGTWTGNLFINNAADRRGVITGGMGEFPSFAFTYIQPRTVGLSLAKSFEAQ